MTVIRTASLFARAFTLDARSIACFRVGLGLVITTDLFLRLLDSERHYSDFGMLPRSLLSYPMTFSLHVLHGSAGFQAALFAIGIVLAVGLTLGVWPRVCAALLFSFTISMQHRNETILEGYDLYSRSLLLCAIFLPLGRQFSLVGSTSSTRHEVATLGTAAVICQIFVVYFFNGVNKLNDSWISGDAIVNALNYLYFPTEFGAWLRNFPDILQSLTIATLVIELFAPLLLISPYLPGLCKGIFVTMFGLMHLGIWLTLDVGLFPAVSMVALLLLIPAKTGTPSAPDLSMDLPLWQKLALLVVVTVVLIFHIGPSIPAYRRSDWSRPIARIVEALRLQQRWTMFHSVPRTTFWPLILGQTKDGRIVRLPDFEEFKSVDRTNLQARFARHRQKKEFLALHRSGSLYDSLRERYLARACKGAPVQLTQVNLYVLRLPDALQRGLASTDIRLSKQCTE